MKMKKEKKEKIKGYQFLALGQNLTKKMQTII
jgi:hypothetical protein